MKTKNLRALSFITFVITLAVSSASPQALGVCDEYYNQGGCGCSGWITVNYPFEGEGSCADTADCAMDICTSECGQFASPWSYGACGQNEWSEWQGFKCDPFPCPD